MERIAKLYTQLQGLGLIEWFSAAITVLATILGVIWTSQPARA